MALQASSPAVILPQVLPAVVLSTYPNSELSFPCLVAKMTFESSLVMAEPTQSTCGFLRANPDCVLGWGRPAGHGAGLGLVPRAPLISLLVLHLALLLLRVFAGIRGSHPNATHP